MSSPLHLFAGFGVELEYMLVDRRTLAVMPIADQILAAEAGGPASEVETGPIGWSNELAAHVLELKTNGPVGILDAAKAQDFLTALRRVDELAAERGARVMPTAMHPLMDPARELELWPHDNHPIYAAYDRIFGCTGHGWANLQSCHLNLPFCGDAELHRLHSAIRPVLPLLPGLAASSPVMEGRLSGTLDTRLAVYRDNQRRLPSIIGHVIPEVVGSRQEYEEHILAPMYREIAPLDPEGLLQHEWLNSRGAIARFDRGAVEIRLLDVQETPLADMAITRLVATTVRALAEERWVPLAELDRLSSSMLLSVLDDTIVDAERTVIRSEALLRALGYDGHEASLAELWTHLAEALVLDHLPARGVRGALATILGRGTLATRIVQALGKRPTHEGIIEVYRRVADCAVAGELFAA